MTSAARPHHRTTAPGRGRGVRPPTVPEVAYYLELILGDVFPWAWKRLREQARITGTESDRDSFDRLITVMMTSPDRLLVLCARSLVIRLNAYDQVYEIPGAAAKATEARRTHP